MSAAVSTLGIVHTAVSVLPIGLGLVAFAREGRIDYRNGLGKTYWWTMFAASVMSFGIAKNGTFGVPHVLTVVTLAILLAGMLAPRLAWLGRWSTYAETASYTTTYFLLMVFATTETLSRIPVGSPLAKGPEDPLLMAVHAGLFAAYLAGLAYQFNVIHKAENRGTAQHAGHPAAAMV